MPGIGKDRGIALATGRRAIVQSVQKSLDARPIVEIAVAESHDPTIGQHQRIEEARHCGDGSRQHPPLVAACLFGHRLARRQEFERHPMVVRRQFVLDAVRQDLPLNHLVEPAPGNRDQPLTMRQRRGRIEDIERRPQPDRRPVAFVATPLDQSEQNRQLPEDASLDRKPVRHRQARASLRPPPRKETPPVLDPDRDVEQVLPGIGRWLIADAVVLADPVEDESLHGARLTLLPEGMEHEKPEPVEIVRPVRRARIVVPVDVRWQVDHFPVEGEAVTRHVGARKMLRRHEFRRCVDGKEHAIVEEAAHFRRARHRRHPYVGCRD